MTHSGKTSRLEARLTPEALALIRQAAEIQGRNLSDFVVAAAQEVARKTIDENQIIRLSAEDQQRFAELILDPPPLTAAMRDAKAAHSRLIGRSD